MSAVSEVKFEIMFERSVANYESVASGAVVLLITLVKVEVEELMFEDVELVEFEIAFVIAVKSLAS